MDNYYNSVTLCRELISRKTYATGTLRQNRKGNPPEVISKKLKRGESITKYSSGIGVGKWKDRRDVLFISTEFGGELANTENRRGEEKQKPNAIIHYNKNMSGIDRQDQMLSYYGSERKTIRWYKKIAIHIISVMLLNAFYLYNTYSTKKKLNYYDFRHCIIKNLLSQAESQLAAADRPKKKNKEEQLLHAPEKYHLDDKGRQKRKRCRVCYEKNIRKDTPYFCPDCPDQPGLCLGDCFKVHHRKQ